MDIEDLKETLGDGYGEGPIVSRYILRGGIDMSGVERRVNAGVSVVVFDSYSSKILMLRRKGSHGAGTWSCPGGWMRFGESPEETVIREVAEEVGIEIGSPWFVTVTNDLFLEEDVHASNLWYIAPARTYDVVNKEPNKADYVEWFSFSNLPSPLFLPWSLVSRDLLEIHIEDYISTITEE